VIRTHYCICRISLSISYNICVKHPDDHCSRFPASVEDLSLTGFPRPVVQTHEYRRPETQELSYVVVIVLLIDLHHKHGARRHRYFGSYPCISDSEWHHRLTVVDSFQLFSSCRSHSQLDARSAAWLSLWIVLRLSLPVVPIAATSRHTY